MKERRYGISKTNYEYHRATALGFLRDYLQKAVHCKHADEFVYRTGRGGKFMVDTEKFDKAIRKKWMEGMLENSKKKGR